jgi:hypothetical protein
VRVIGRLWSRLRLDWEIGLHRLPFFTQKVAVMLLGVLVATLALLGGLATLVGPPGADGPDRLVPGSTPRPPAPARPAPGQVGGRGEAAGGAATAASAGGAGGGQAAGAGGTGAGAPAGAAGRAPAAAPTPRAGAGGAAPAAPPTTTAPATTTGRGGLPPLKEVVSSVVSTLLP